MLLAMIFSRFRNQSAPFAGKRPPRHASSFADQDAAETVLGALLEVHRDEILEWLSSGRPWLMVEDHFDQPTGHSASVEGIEEVTGARVVLARAAEMPDGFRVHNGYPQRARTPRTDHPSLRHLTGVYFHQEWAEDFNSYPGAVAAFLRDSPELAASLLDELATIRPLPEAELDDLLHRLGSEFTLSRDETWHDWLDDLTRRLEVAAQGIR